MRDSRRDRQRLNRDQIGESSEVALVGRQEPPDPMCQHGGHDVGIVHLFAADGDLLEQCQEAVCDVRSIFGHPKPHQETADICRQGFDWQRVGERLWAAEYREIFS